MPILRDIKGTLGVFWKDAKEDFAAMDHKILRIASAIATVVVAYFVWTTLLRGIVPF